MPLFDIQISETIVVRSVEASDSSEASAIIVADIEKRYPPNTDVVAELTTIEDVTVYE